MTGRYNAGTTVLKMQGTYGNFQVWLNKKGIANLISIPVLEANGYILSTHTHRNWLVTTPQGTDITFKMALRYKLWPDAVNTVTKVEHYLVGPYLASTVGVGPS